MLGNWGKLRERRQGIMLHYDASASDPGAVAWLTRDPACKVSYTWLVLDTGHVVPIAPESARAWHAGVCRSSDVRLAYRDANSAFYGLALAMGAKDTVTAEALAAVVQLCRGMFVARGWNPVTEGWRIVGHDAHCWKRGRKVDPTGPDPAKPVLSVAAVRDLVAST